MKDSLETKLGIFFALALIALLIILESLGGFNFFKSGYHVSAFFKNAQELKVGDQVKMAGVRIGSVERIELTNGVVRVDMNLNRDAEVRLDSKASIRFMGLMGQNYVALDFGSPTGKRAENGATLEGKEMPDMNTVLAKLDNAAGGIENLTRSFSGEKIDALLGPFTDFLKANQGNLTMTISNIRTATDRIVAGQGTVGKLINEDTLYQTALTTVSNLQGTASDIQGTANEARTFITNVNNVVSQINAGQGTVGKLVKEDKLYVETTEAMTNLKEILQKVNRGQGSVGKLVNDESLLKNVKMSLQKLDKATESLEDTGPLSVMGSMMNSLF
jgi:phospholipid/cholesterol/gamma-HCH transport system substrate-binding protein